MSASTEASPDMVLTRRRPLRKFLKFLGYVALLLAVVGVAAQLIYSFSGARAWKQVADTNGIKVYAMKLPGENLEKFKAIFTVKAKLATIVAFMQDNDSDLDVSFYGARELERHGPQEMVTQWKSKLPKPFSDRDFVVRHMFVQDPATKEIVYSLQALPDLIPRESCCVRVPLMNNDWEIVPKKGGLVEIRWFIDMNVGGAMPYFIMNAANPSVMVDFASDLQGYLDRPKYANPKIDWITEPQG